MLAIADDFVAFFFVLPFGNDDGCCSRCCCLSWTIADVDDTLANFKWISVSAVTDGSEGMKARVVDCSHL